MEYGEMLRLLYVLLGIITLLYTVYAGYFYANQRAILFPRHLLTPPGAAPAVPGLEQMWLTTSVGQVEAWYLPPLDVPNLEPAPLMIVAHGNGDVMDNWLDAVPSLRQMGIGVLAVEFPGYGRSAGSPSQATIEEAFLLAYDTIIQHPRVDPARIILFGHSVGGGAISTLAAARPSAGLILFSTFTSVRALAAAQWLPSWAARDPFDNLAVVRDYPNPVLIIHGTRDRTIPYAHGVALHAAARQGELMALDCGHGGCISDWDEFWQELRPFFARTGIL